MAYFPVFTCIFKGSFVSMVTQHVGAARLRAVELCCLLSDVYCRFSFSSFIINRPYANTGQVHVYRSNKTRDDVCDGLICEHVFVCIVGLCGIMAT